MFGQAVRDTATELVLGIGNRKENNAVGAFVVVVFRASGGEIL